MDADSFKCKDSTYKAIVLPFSSRWKEDVTAGHVKVVFRKKGPSARAAPQWAYAYFGSPISAICAKLRLDSIKTLPLHEALQLSRDGLLTEEELENYAGDTGALCVFRVGQCILGEHTVGMTELFEKFGFQPTPSFVAISDEGIRQLDLVMKIKAATKDNG